jgi:hypothetical protein
MNVTKQNDIPISSVLGVGLLPSHDYQYNLINVSGNVYNFQFTEPDTYCLISGDDSSQRMENNFIITFIDHRTIQIDSL